MIRCAGRFGAAFPAGFPCSFFRLTPPAAAHKNRIPAATVHTRCTHRTALDATCYGQPRQSLLRPPAVRVFSPLKSTSSGHFTAILRESPASAVHFNDSLVSRLTLPQAKNSVRGGNTALIFAVRSDKPMDFSVSVSREQRAQEEAHFRGMCARSDAVHAVALRLKHGRDRQRGHGAVSASSNDGVSPNDLAAAACGPVSGKTVRKRANRKRKRQAAASSPASPAAAAEGAVLAGAPPASPDAPHAAGGPPVTPAPPRKHTAGSGHTSAAPAAAAGVPPTTGGPPLSASVLLVAPTLLRAMASPAAVTAPMLPPLPPPYQAPWVPPRPSTPTRFAGGTARQEPQLGDEPVRRADAAALPANFSLDATGSAADVVSALKSSPRVPLVEAAIDKMTSFFRALWPGSGNAQRGGQRGTPSPPVSAPPRPRAAAGASALSHAALVDAPPRAGVNLANVQRAGDALDNVSDALAGAVPVVSAAADARPVPAQQARSYLPFPASTPDSSAWRAEVRSDTPDPAALACQRA